MESRKKKLLMDFIKVTVITALVICGMIIYKDWVNRSEAVRAMEGIGREVVEYRKANASVPSEAWIEGRKEFIAGALRLGDVNYRSLWIKIDTPPDEIFAYTTNGYGFFFKKEFIVLRLNGNVDLMSEQQLKQELAKIQSPAELHSLTKKQRPEEL